MIGSNPGISMVGRALSGRLVVGALAALGAALAAPLGGAIRDAAACSCVGPRASVIGPDRVDDAPLNVRVRAEVPRMGERTSAPSPPHDLVLRVHGGAVVETTSRVVAPGGWVMTVELAPKVPLAPATQYEVATIDPAAHPSVIVLGTFKTGTAPDTTPPRIDAMGAAVATKRPNAQGAACQVPGPWVTIGGVRAEDPGRPSAKLLFGVWVGDAAGNADTRKPPAAFVRAHEGVLQIGQSSLCDPRSFPFPKGAASMWLVIAALDEAGNSSAPRKVKVDLAGARTL